MLKTPNPEPSDPLFCGNCKRLAMSYVFYSLSMSKYCIMMVTVFALSTVTLAFALLIMPLPISME